MALGLGVWFVFGQTLGHAFVNYDNDLYVYDNEHIKAGLSFKGIVWAFTHLFVDQWCPLTAISHMADCEIFGLFAGGHHLTNVLLHTATVILLFLTLRNMTQSLWGSAFVAAVFAVHPLRVESVVWVSERKDVLSGLFFVLTLWAYVKYAQRQATAKADLGAGASLRGDWRARLPVFYVTALLCFALGLLSKAMLVTTPFVLLLLDWWPLRRFGFASGSGPANAGVWKRLILEKIPFVLLAAASSAVTLLTDKGLNPVEVVTGPWRLANAVVAYAIYLKQMFYPVGLAVFYPHPENRLSLGLLAVSAFVLLVLTVVAVVGRRKRPYMLVGWLWYLGMLVPVIGLVHVGSQAHADRYTYLPQIGIYLILAWGAAGLGVDWRYRRVVGSIVAGLVLIALGVRAHQQTKVWRDSISLWEHTLACTSDNYVAHLNLGSTLADVGKLDEAMPHYEAALKIKPSYAEAHYNLAVALGLQGRLSEAIPHYERAIQFKPSYAGAYNNLGNALVAQGKLDEAIQHYERAVQLNSKFPEVYYNWGNALTKQGKPKEAIQYYERALQVNPNYVEAHFNLAKRLSAEGLLDEAIRHYERCVQLRPDYAEAYNNLGNRLAVRKRWEEAYQSFQRALQLKPDYAEAHNNWGVALAGEGKLDKAIQQYEQAVRVRPGYAEAQANLGSLYGQQGNLDKALEYLHEALNAATAETNPVLARAILKRIESLQAPPSPSPSPLLP